MKQNYDLVSFQIETIQNNEGHCEINPEEFFNNIVAILRDSLKSKKY